MLLLLLFPFLRPSSSAAPTRTKIMPASPHTTSPPAGTFSVGMAHAEVPWLLMASQGLLGGSRSPWLCPVHPQSSLHMELCCPHWLLALLPTSQPP